MKISGRQSPWTRGGDFAGKREISYLWPLSTSLKISGFDRTEMQHVEIVCP